MAVHHKLLSGFIERSNPETDKQIVRMVLQKSEWFDQVELVEQIAKKGPANKEIKELILTSKEWQRVLTQKYKAESITLEQLKLSNQ